MQLDTSFLLHILHVLLSDRSHFLSTPIYLSNVCIHFTRFGPLDFLSNVCIHITRIGPLDILSIFQTPVAFVPKCHEPGALQLHFTLE